MIVRPPGLCCLVNPFVVCVECLTPACEKCAYADGEDWHKVPCEGRWFSTSHEAITQNATLRRRYIPKYRLPLPHKKTDGMYV